MTHGLLTESMILCEGYHDRSFWGGWLRHAGFDSCEPPVYDPFGTRVDRGQHGFVGTAGGFLRVQPCGGDTKVYRRATKRLEDRNTRSLTSLLISVDLDGTDQTAEQRLKSRRDQLRQLVVTADPNAKEDGPDRWLIDRGCTAVELHVWRTPAGKPAGVPETHTLERLAAWCVAEAYPARAPHVQRWLDERPGVTTKPAKAFAWSYMAGWSAEAGCARFYQALWDDEAIRGQVERCIQALGDWERLAHFLETAK